MAKAKAPRLIRPKAKEVEPRVEPKVEPKLEAVEPRLEAPAAEPQVYKPEGDYLRQYQYRKQTESGSPESDPQTGSKAAKMKEFLLSRPVIRMFIPQAAGFSKSVKQDVNLNGYHLQFPRNAYVDVPEPVADVLRESLQQTEEALSFNRIGVGSDKEKALA